MVRAQTKRIDHFYSNRIKQCFKGKAIQFRKRKSCELRARILKLFTTGSFIKEYVCDNVFSEDDKVVHLTVIHMGVGPLRLTDKRV